MTRPDAVLDALHSAATQWELTTAAQLAEFDRTHCARCGEDPNGQHCQPTAPKGATR